MGNLFVYFQFQGLDHIDVDTRTVVMWVLSGVTVLGLIFLIILPKPRRDSNVNAVEEPNRGPAEAFKAACRLFVTKKMMLLSITFFYTGKSITNFFNLYVSQ